MIRIDVGRAVERRNQSDEGPAESVVQTTMTNVPLEQKLNTGCFAFAFAFTFACPFAG